MYSWLLFDADDTLFDFPKAEAKALRQTLEALGLPYLEAYGPIYSNYNQQVWLEFERKQITRLELRVKRFQLFFEAAGLSTADPRSASPIYLQNLAQAGDLFPDAAEVVHTLKKRYQLALVTNGLKDVQRPRLANSPIRDAFAHIFISEEMGAAKPDPAYFDIVFATMGQPAKNQVLIIGDSLTSDMQGGLDYGIDTCWYNPAGKTSNLPMTHQVKNLTELLILLA